MLMSFSADDDDAVEFSESGKPVGCYRGNHGSIRVSGLSRARRPPGRHSAEAAPELAVMRLRNFRKRRRLIPFFRRALDKESFDESMGSPRGFLFGGNESAMVTGNRGSSLSSLGVVLA